MYHHLLPLTSSCCPMITRLAAVFLLSPSLFLACTERDVDASAAEKDHKRAAMATYAEIAYSGYADSHALALALEEKVKALVAAPSPTTLQAARDAWLAAREPYGQTEVFRFYGGPIDRAGGPEPLINAWPLDESYIDYVIGDADAGTINDPVRFPTIDKALLVSLNEQGAEEHVSVGFHAIEFLLWGQDRNADGPGNRPYTDYLVTGEASHPQRRGRYLVACAELLVEKLAEVRDAWAPDRPHNYRAEFLRLPPDEALVKMLTGMGVLSKAELAGERLFTAYDNRDQEDEHSCFSDNTHRDIVNNALGIRNVYRGEYLRVGGERVAGTGLGAVLAEVDPALDEHILALLDTSNAAVARIHVPFDQAIVLASERPQVLETVRVLQRLGNQFAQAGTALGLRVNTSLP